MALEDDIRTALHEVMGATLQDEAAHQCWFYDAVRPMPVPTRTRKFVAIVRKRGDCSKGVQYVCWWVPYCPDPMGRGFDPIGNSQTLAMNLHHLNAPNELWVGDIVTFGSWGQDHAAMVMEEGDNPLLWSFGHQGAPNTYRLSYDRRPRQYLRLPAPATPQTPQDYLRARTGWFAWVAWRLGEGSWKHYGPAQPSVRPNVPKHIPAQWWIRLAQFLTDRKKGYAPSTH